VERRARSDEPSRSWRRPKHLASRLWLCVASTTTRDGIGRRGCWENTIVSVETVLPHAFTVRDAVRFSGLSRSRLYQLIKDSNLPSFTIGGRRMILRKDLEALFA
jgi:hypothetical protein